MAHEQDGAAPGRHGLHLSQTLALEGRIADGELWETHMLLKGNLINAVRDAMACQHAMRTEPTPAAA